jgi:hypothetical protein
LTLTFAPLFSFVPRRGCWLTTLPRNLRGAATRVTVPSRQWAFASAVLAAASRFPRRLGTMQRGEAGGVSAPVRPNVAVTDFAASIVTLQEPVPLHAPAQPAKVEPTAAAALSVTTVAAL